MFTFYHYIHLFADINNYTYLISVGNNGVIVYNVTFLT